MKVSLFLLVFVLSACSNTRIAEPKPDSSSTLTDVMQLIERSEESAPEGVTGAFVFVIKASGRENGTTYLNTQLDYRDRRNITLALLPNTVSAFTKKYGAPPHEYFIGKTVNVRGAAKRFKTWFSVEGRRTDKYYLQTHINIDSVDQIAVL